MQQLRILKQQLRGIVVAFVIIPALLSSGGLAAADGPTALYSYNFLGTSGTVANTGNYNPTLSLALLGSWTPSATGANFAGDTVSQQSVAFAKPATGYSLNLTAAQTVGFGAHFTYLAPTNGCFADSPNITQIGRFAANTAQAKLQYSNCTKGATSEYIQCRFAGVLTPTSVLPIISTQALQNGSKYVVTCVKSADNGQTATVTLSVTRLGGSYGNVTTVDTYTVAATGALQTKAAVSVANKYPLPSISNNTDQFVGDMAKVAYCGSSLASDVTSCLTTELPLQ